MVLNLVTSLHHLCLPSIKELVYQTSLTTARNVSRMFPDSKNFSGEDESPGKDTFLSEMVSVMKKYLLDHVVWYLYEEVCQAVMDGLDKATEEVKEQGKTMNNLSRMHELGCIIKLAEVSLAIIYGWIFLST